MLNKPWANYMSKIFTVQVWSQLPLHHSVGYLNPNLSVNHLRGMKGEEEENDSISAWNEWIPVSWMLNAISLSSQPANNAVESKKRRKKNGRRFHAQESAARFFCSDLPLFRLSTYQSKKNLRRRRRRLNGSGGAWMERIVNVSLRQQRWNYYKLMEKFKLWFLVGDDNRSAAEWLNLTFRIPSSRNGNNFGGRSVNNSR